MSTGNRFDRHLFGPEGAPLSAEGREDAAKLRPQLTDLGIDPTTEPVAVSELIRTYETAEQLGFRQITAYGSLNEINTGLTPDELNAMLARKALPEIAYQAARIILADPPSESVWVTHGMVIGALAHELDIPADTLFVPAMATITRLELA